MFESLERCLEASTHRGQFRDPIESGLEASLGRGDISLLASGREVRLRNGQLLDSIDRGLEATACRGRLLQHLLPSGIAGLQCNNPRTLLSATLPEAFQEAAVLTGVIGDPPVPGSLRSLGRTTHGTSLFG